MDALAKRQMDLGQVDLGGYVVWHRSFMAKTTPFDSLQFLTLFGDSAAKIRLLILSSVLA